MKAAIPAPKWNFVNFLLFIYILRIELSHTKSALSSKNHSGACLLLRGLWKPAPVLLGPWNTAATVLGACHGAYVRLHIVAPYTQHGKRQAQSQRYSWPRPNISDIQLHLIVFLNSLYDGIFKMPQTFDCHTALMENGLKNL